MQATINKAYSLLAEEMQTSTKLEEQLRLKRLCQGDRSAFWQLWQQHQDYLYHRCLRWMGGNYTEAEEAFSQAMLKAWDKLPDYAGKIANLRAWLTRLTHNLCVDIHRERHRRAMESIEEIVVSGNEAVVSSFDSPELAILRHELGWYIRRTVNALPSRLRTPFILRYYYQISERDIAQLLALSLDNVYKRIQQAREILQRRLRRYLSGLDDARLDSSELSSDRDVADSLRHSFASHRDDFAFGVAPPCLPRQDCGATTGRSPLQIQQRQRESVVEKCQADEIMIDDSEAAIAMRCMGETINYQVTATCLETLPHGWYRSFSPLGCS